MIALSFSSSAIFRASRISSRRSARKMTGFSPLAYGARAASLGSGTGGATPCGLRLGGHLVVGQGPAELLLDRLEPVEALLRRASGASPWPRPGGDRVGPDEGGDVDVQGHAVGQDHLAGDPAVEVDHAALAGDRAAGRLDVGGEDAVGPGHGDQLAVGVQGRAGPQLGLELGRVGVVLRLAQAADLEQADGEPASIRPGQTSRPCTSIVCAAAGTRRLGPADRGDLAVARRPACRRRCRGR